MNTNCSICLKPVQDSTNIIVTECGHTFHCLCLMTNVLYNGFECPYCQTKMADQVSNEDDEDEDDDEGFTPIYHFRRFLDADEEEQWGTESDSCDEFGSGYGAVEDSDDGDDYDTECHRLLCDDILRGFRLFNNLLDGVDHDDADDAYEEYYNIRCDPYESIAGFNRRTGHRYNENGYDDG